MEALLYTLIVVMLFTPIISFRFGVLGGITSSIVSLYTAMLLLIYASTTEGYMRALWTGTGVFALTMFVVNLGIMSMEIISWWRRSRYKPREPDIPW